MSEPLAPPPPPSGGSGYGGPPAGGPPTGGPLARPGLPWEQHKDPGSLLETTKRLITAPSRAFAEAREKGDYGSPLLFAVVMILLGAIFGVVWQMLFGGPGRYLEDMQDLPPELAGLFATAVGPGQLVLTLVLAPIFGLVGLFIWTGIVHLVLMMLGGLRDSTAGFEGTFRSSAYSSVSQLAQVVPIVGGLVAFAWGLGLQMIGLSSIHRISQGKALAAVLIPFVVCCCGGIALAIAFAGAIAAAVGAGGS